MALDVIFDASSMAASPIGVGRTGGVKRSLPSLPHCWKSGPISASAGTAVWPSRGVCRGNAPACCTTGLSGNDASTWRFPAGVQRALGESLSLTSRWRFRRTRFAVAVSTQFGLLSSRNSSFQGAECRFVLEQASGTPAPPMGVVAGTPVCRQSGQYFETQRFDCALGTGRRSRGLEFRNPELRDALVR